MPERFIVTVTDGKRFEVDLAIPSRQPIGELRAKLLEILQSLDVYVFQGWQGVALSFDGYTILEKDTLADVGAFDGSRIIVSNN